MTTALQWIDAARPKTLGAVIAPCAIAAGVTVAEGSFDGVGFAVALCGGLAVQVLTNLVNDLVDGVRGTDGPERLGPRRAIASGVITVPSMVVACILMACIAVACAAFLTMERSLWFAPLALASLALALAYSAGPWPLSYTGAAEPFAILFFGPFACAACVAAQTGEWCGPAWWLGMGPGGLSLALLAINNLRDVEGDRRAGKQTLAVRCGPLFARMEVAMGVACATTVAAVLLWLGSIAAIVPLGVMVPAWAVVLRVASGASGASLNRELSRVGLLTALYGVALAGVVAWCGVPAP